MENIIALQEEYIQQYIKEKSRAVFEESNKKLLGEEWKLIQYTRVSDELKLKCQYPHESGRTCNKSIKNIYTIMSDSGKQLKVGGSCLNKVVPVKKIDQIMKKAEEIKSTVNAINKRYYNVPKKHFTLLQKQEIIQRANEVGYATPKVDVRAVIFKSDCILLVKEKADGKWSLPGGWGDIGLTPSEVAVKEVREEAGFDVKAHKLLAVFDKKCHPHPPSPYHVYKFFIQCDIVGGQAREGIETDDVAFFSKDDLPPLSVERNTESQIQIAFQYLVHPETPTYFD
ncbi:NUDIX domain-containing protein [Jeotgalibaca porci]|uniref:NUDIX domain-containing protein n=1 Tax=Jeotgalibaca porci TaxID=1868793 RepID=UPI0035A12C94